MLLTKLQPLFRFHFFSPLIPFVLFQDLLHSSTVHLDFVAPNFNLWRFLSLSLYFMTFLKCNAQVSCRISLNLGLSNVFSWLDWGCGCLFSKNTRKMVCLSQGIMSGSTWCWCVLFLVMLNLISWLRCSLKGKHCKGSNFRWNAS